MEFESVVEGLYSLPREEFTAARNAAVARAREQGQGDLAGRIGALRRPSTAAWLANLLAREHPEQIQALSQLGERMRVAQRQGDGDALRRLSQQRHALIQTIVAQVRSMAGHPVSEAISGELVNTFTAAVNSPAAADALAGARLTVALDPADAAAEFFAGAGAGAGARAGAGAGAGAAEPSRPAPVDPDDPELERVRQEAADADTARDQAQRALTDAEQALAEAATALRELRARLAALERAEREAQHQALAAEREFAAADQRARNARWRVRDLEQTRASS